MSRALPFVGAADTTYFRGAKYMLRLWPDRPRWWGRFRNWLSRRICAIWEFQMAPIGNPYGYPHFVVPRQYPEWFRALALGAPLFSPWLIHTPSYGRETKHVFKGRDGVWYCRTTFKPAQIEHYDFDLRKILTDNALKDLDPGNDYAKIDEIFQCINKHTHTPPIP